MTPRRKNNEGSTFGSVSQNDLPDGRKGKHHSIVAQLLHDIELLEEGRALKIPIAELPDSKANIRSALTRSSKQKGLDIATSSDEEFLYVWKVEPESNQESVDKVPFRQQSTMRR